MKFLGLLLTGAVALTCVTMASASESELRLIKLFSQTTTSELMRESLPLGDSKGDVYIGSSRLKNATAQFGKRKGAVVGRDRYRFDLSSAEVATMRVTATLPGGTITCRGLVNLRGVRYVVRVVAATGAFARARGTCEATGAPKNRPGGEALNTYKLHIPG